MQIGSKNTFGSACEFTSEFMPDLFKRRRSLGGHGGGVGGGYSRSGSRIKVRQAAQQRNERRERFCCRSQRKRRSHHTRAQRRTIRIRHWSRRRPLERSRPATSELCLECEQSRRRNWSLIRHRTCSSQRPGDDRRRRRRRRRPHRRSANSRIMTIR